MKPDVRIFDTLTALDQAAAAHFSEKVIQAVKKRGAAHVALSGGSTPQGLFRLLAGTAYADIPWRNVHVYWADERCVPPTDAESNYGQARQLLLDHVPLIGGNVHRMHGEMEPVNAVAEYIRQLETAAGAGKRWPTFDWLLLGMGADGHVASLFPGKPHPQEGSSPVVFTRGNYQGRPANRLSLTPLIMNNARHIVFMVTGENKAQVAALALYGPHDPQHFPAQRIQPLNGDVTWFLDRTAAQGIQEQGWEQY